MTKILDEEKIKRLKNVLETIEAYKKDERYFEKLYDILNEEYRLEGGKTAEYVFGNYRHNLEQTIRKQALPYIDAKKRRPVKGAPSEYRDFVDNFKQDVTQELGLYRF